MHHMGVYETYVVLKDSDLLAQKMIAKVKYNCHFYSCRDAKMAPSKLLSIVRARWYFMGLLDLEKNAVEF